MLHHPPAVFTLVTDNGTSDYCDTTEERAERLLLVSSIQDEAGLVSMMMIVSMVKVRPL